MRIHPFSLWRRSHESPRALNSHRGPLGASFIRSIVRTSVACFALLLCSASPAAATYIRLVAEVDAQLDQGGNTLAVKLTVRNEGDEPASDVRADFFELNRSFQISRDLKPGEQSEWSGSFALVDLRAQGDGQFLVPYRLTYRDGNYYPFSVPYSFVFEHGQAPTRSTMTHLDGVSSTQPVQLGTKTAVRFDVNNIGGDELVLESVSLLSSSEITGIVEGFSAQPLAPGAKVSLRLALENNSGIPSSSYAAQIVARGKHHGLAFADVTTFQIEITDGKVSPPFLFGAIAALGGTMLIAALLFRRRRSASPALDGSE